MGASHAQNIEEIAIFNFIFKIIKIFFCLHHKLTNISDKDGRKLADLNFKHTFIDS